MKISEVIHWLEVQKNTHGDVRLFVKDNDGRSTSAIPVGYFNGPHLRHEEIWKGHPAGKKWLISL